VNGEDEGGTAFADVPRDIACYLTVDIDPALQAAAKMHLRDAQHEERTAVPELLRAPQSATDHVHGAELARRELPYGGRFRGQVAIHQSHLRAEVAAREMRKTAAGARTVVPSQSGQSQWPREATEKEGSVRRTRDRGKDGGHSPHLTFRAKASERGGSAGVDCVPERIRSSAICK